MAGNISTGRKHSRPARCPAPGRAPGPALRPISHRELPRGLFHQCARSL